MTKMHDWTLLSIHFEWKTAVVRLSFRDNRSPVSVLAEGVVDLHVPQVREWGPSVSVNKVRGPSNETNRLSKLEIEMQSGDVITIVASSFVLPDAMTSKSPS